MTHHISDIIIYQTDSGALELMGDVRHDTIWASQAQMAEIFWIDQSVISRHISTIFKNGEVDKKSNMQKMHTANSDKPVAFYSLDIILAVWYRWNSQKAIAFRRWSNAILKDYIFQWVAINNTLLEKNTQKFQQALEYLSSLDPRHISKLESGEILSLIQNYAQTWLCLDAYDKQLFPESGFTSMDLTIHSSELLADIGVLRKNLIAKNEATELFAREKIWWSLEWIIGNIFQTFGWTELYPSLEEKAAHLLYFVIKNHPFVDGNKRSWAFAFLWFLQKSQYKHISRISPETLTTLTLLIAQSDPREKEKMTGLVLLLLQ
jgi:Virulence protein RhuM family/Fic/DOC family